MPRKLQVSQISGTWMMAKCIPTLPSQATSCSISMPGLACEAARERLVKTASLWPDSWLRGMPQTMAHGALHTSPTVAKLQARTPRQSFWGLLRDLGRRLSKS